VHDFDEQNLEALAWAFATAGYRAPTLFKEIAQEATARAPKFNSKQITNIVWAVVTALSKEPRRGGGDEDATMSVEVADLVAALRSEALQHLGRFDLISLHSMYRTLTMAGVLPDDLQQQILDFVACIVKKKDLKEEERILHDSEKDVSGPSGSATFQHEEVRREAEESVSHSSAPLRLRNEPRVLSEGEHWIAFYKPPLWIVDVDDKTEKRKAGSKHVEGENAGSVDDETLAKRTQKRSQMQNWIADNFQHKYRICSDPAESHGLLHRIDSDTSGLLLCAKDYEGHYHLRLKWNDDSSEKEYICLVHGWVNPSVREVNRRIRKGAIVFDDSQQISSMYCTISPSGKPARTELITLAHLVKLQSQPETGMESSIEVAATETLERGAAEQHYSLVAVKLHTGRTHQIRVHMLSIGHPLVSDNKYNREFLSLDSTFCARHFLHTHRLGFKDATDGAVSVNCPLPEDLRHALRSLKPADDRSAEFQRDWTSGERERMREFDTYAHAVLGATASSGN